MPLPDQFPPLRPERTSAVIPVYADPFQDPAGECVMSLLSRRSRIPPGAMERLPAARTVPPLLATAARAPASMISDGRCCVVANVPACATLNTTGDVEHFQLLMPDRPMAAFATGPAAVSHGVNLFVLSDKDAQMRYGSQTPAYAKISSTNSYGVQWAFGIKGTF